jgi:hypothetical protein
MGSTVSIKLMTVHQARANEVGLSGYDPAPLTKADLKALAAFLSAIADAPVSGQWTIGNIRLQLVVVES